MSDLPEISVLIVGAGPTGLALACDLARRGVDFRIVDQANAAFAGSRGKGLQPRSLEVLEDLGVVEAILANGRFHLPFRAYDGATVLGDQDPHAGRYPTPAVPYASSLIIPQFRVEGILRDRLAALGGGPVELATELTAIAPDDDGVTAVLRHGDATSRVRARYLVAADGGRSFTRKTLGVGFEGETWPDERMLVGDVQASALDRDHWHTWPRHPDGFVALCPLPSTDRFQFQAQVKSDDAEPSLERFQQIVDERTGRHDIRLAAPTWLSLYRANVRMVDRYRVGRVFLAGDAAHVHSPAGGQGMNTGIQDAYNLGWKLAAVLRGADDALLDSYEAERLPIAAWLLGITTQLHRHVFRDDLRAQPRDAAMLQLGLNYRGGTLSEEHDDPPPPLRAGDRAPDAPLRDRAGRPVRLFDLFRGPQFTLLAVGAHDAAGLARVRAACAARPGVLHVHRIGGPDHVATDPTDALDAPDATHDGPDLLDDAGHLRQAYGAREGALFLIRPDGYIGLIGSGRSTDAVRAYLARVVGLA